MQAHVDALTAWMLDDEKQKRINPFGIGLGLSFLGVSAVMALTGASAHSCAWVWYVVACIFGLAGVTESAKHEIRDERGRSVQARSARRRKVEQLSEAVWVQTLFVEFRQFQAQCPESFPGCG